MLLCAQYVLPVSSAPITDGAVLVRDGVIRDVGKADQLRLRYPEEEVIDQGLAALMPGLVDLYTRLEQSVLRGVVNDAPYVQWITEVARKSSRMEASDWFDSAILGGLDALSSGITCVADITTTGASCTAVNKLGLRSVIFRQVGAMDKSRIDAAMQFAQKDILHWREEVDPERVTIGIAATHLFNNHPAMLRAISEFATKEDLPVALWLADSREEYDFVRYGSSPFQVHGGDVKRGYVEIPPWLPTGVSPVRYALNWNAFDAPNVMIVGAVFVDDEDLKKLREYDVAVCCCPRASAQLGKGVAPLDEFLRADLRVGLGTDSPAATESTDMLSEMRLGMLLQRAVNPGRFLDANTMLEVATLGGARALGLDDKIGSLEIGKRADMIAVDLSSSHQSFTTDPVAAVVNTCTTADVLMTMVDGNVLYEKNRWHVKVEVAKNIARVIEIRSKLRPEA
ncbi:amidohydrolase family protein [uncultured Adlercreutzia sp.]|uniref:amidohydrolase family protein n=1 Tax=uncultured Adlercreutzia sp. TaxID=875803 RepID=UPI0025EF747F|nr:amidohydrolase family protein [uncultured Adlercreutzia sp.]